MDEWATTWPIRRLRSANPGLPDCTCHATRSSTINIATTCSTPHNEPQKIPTCEGSPWVVREEVVALVGLEKCASAVRREASTQPRLKAI